LLVLHGDTMRDHEVRAETVHPGDPAHGPDAVAALRHSRFFDRRCEVIGRTDAEPLGKPARADVELRAAGLLALDVDPAANATVGIAVPGAHLLLQHLQRARRAR